MRSAAAGGGSGVEPSARWWNARRLCTRTFSFTVRRSAAILGALRAMHSDVLITKNARISRNHQAL